MPYLRIVRGVTAHFRARAGEWALATMLVIWGWLVYLPEEMFTSPAYAIMRLTAREEVWGMAALIVGGIRLIALILNGTFWKTWYGRFSPHIRSIMAGLSCFVWSQISLGLLLSGEATTGLAIYPVLLLFDFYNVMSAAGDAGATDWARKNGGT